MKSRQKKNERVLRSFIVGFERGVVMAIYRSETKGKREVNVPNWVVALVLTTLILALAVLLMKYLPDIAHWLR